MIQVTSIPAKGKVNLKLVEVTQEEISGDFIYKYTKTWEGLPEEVRNKQMENIQQGKETTVKLTFNKAVKQKFDTMIRQEITKLWEMIRQVRLWRKR